MPATEPTVFLPVWPTAGEPPLTRGRIKSRPEDFLVNEIPLALPEGQGEHLWVRVRKRGWNTTAVAALLAKLAGVGRRDVSHAGLKDRQAVTEQWFSIHLPGRELRLPETPDEGIEILEQRRHGRKLRRGALKGNRFEIVIRDCEGKREAVEDRLGRIAAEGFPNYFGEQRFGRDGGNIPKARQMLRGKRRVRDREQRAMLISTARSLIFNDLLALRIEKDCWRRPAPGDLMQLGDGNSLFHAEAIDDELLARAEAGEVHATGPLAGEAAKLTPSGEALALEQQILDAHAPLVNGLGKQRVASARRALRVLPGGLEHAWLDDTSLRLAFSLPPGSYATALLRELMP